MGFQRNHSFIFINNVELKTEQAIADGNFLEIEMNIFKKEKISILTDRTSLIIENIDVYREESLPESSQYFIIAVYLQDKLLKVGKLLYLLFFFNIL